MLIQYNSLSTQSSAHSVQLTQYSLSSLSVLTQYSLCTHLVLNPVLTLYSVLTQYSLNTQSSTHSFSTQSVLTQCKSRCPVYTQSSTQLVLIQSVSISTSALEDGFTFTSCDLRRDLGKKTQGLAYKIDRINDFPEDRPRLSNLRNEALVGQCAV